MTDEWTFAELRDPIAGEQPCGENLEDSLLLASFDGYRVFGQMVPFDKAPDWREIKRRAAEALRKSRDYRLLAHLAVAALWLDGPRPFFGLLNVAADWLENHWRFVYPLVDDDAVLRKNALNCFADRMAVVEGLRRLPLVTHPQLGAFSLKDIELITRSRVAADGEREDRDATQLDAAFAAMQLNDLHALHHDVTQGLAALTRIEQKMRSENGVQAAPSFDLLLQQLRKIERVFADQLAKHPDAEGAEPMITGTFPLQRDSLSLVEIASHSPHTAAGLLTIESRPDAIRALDAVAAYFRHHEPSSPIPVLLERAKRLVAKDFFEVLADIAPDAVAQAKAAGGIRDDSHA